MAAYWVDIFAVGFFILEWTVYAVTLEHTAYGRDSLSARMRVLLVTTAMVVIVTWRRQFASNAWRAMGR
ncbi:MAG: hypothetical protein QOJ96_736 [Alphaproteobacteria bacterium]|jgi:uncharacterized membrane protein|nr:hypothetical protein [Alphaproteobacteria bacterium]